MAAAIWQPTAIVRNVRVVRLKFVQFVSFVDKEELRREIRRLKRQYTPQQLEQLSQSVVARLTPRLAEAQVILAYYSLPDEVCTHQLIDDLVAAGKTVLLPTVIGDSQLEWHVYTTESALKRSTLGICESEDDIYPETKFADFGHQIRRFWSPNSPILVSKEASSSMKQMVALVPGMAFDAAGHRLGRGRGYYDRFLAAHPYIYKIGVCFDFQKVPEVPVDEFDIPVDDVI